MNSKRVFGITIFGVLIVTAVVCAMLLYSFSGGSSGVIPLPPQSPVVERPDSTDTDALNRVEVTRENVQAVISTLSRPSIYRRSIVIESFWQDGLAEYDVSVSVSDGVTSLRWRTSAGDEKRVIVTPDRYYIWYSGGNTPFVGDFESIGAADRLADELQMIFTYEDILKLDLNDIIEAGFAQFNGEDCIYAVYLSPLMRFTRRYYVSIESGLLVGATEHEHSGILVYKMTASAVAFDEIDPAVFILPDGSSTIYEDTDHL